MRLFTGGKLTFPADKMVAISGLAKQAHEETGDQYLAGLWRKDIELQLLWCPQALCKRLPAGSAYRAPSWSWGSMDENAFVYYHPRHETSKYVYYAHVIDAHVVPAGKDQPFGELVGGVLKMSCASMLAGKLRKGKRSEWNGRSFDFYELDIESLDGKSESFRVYLDSDEHDGEVVYILPVTEILGKEKFNKRTLSGLLLRPTGDLKGEYTRAGFFSFMAGDSNERLQNVQERFFKMLESSGKATAEAQCAEILSKPEILDERYVITII